MRLLLVLLPLLAAAPVAAQPSFVAIPPERALQYHIDFTNFYPSDDAERADRERTRALLQELRSLEGRVTASPANLLNALRLREQVSARYNRHIIYQQLRFATNATASASRVDAESLQSEMAGGIAFVRSELVALDDATLARHVASEPALAAYAFVLESARRYRPYTRPAGEETVLARLSALTGSLPAQLYREAVRRANPGTLEVDGRQQSVSALANHADPRVREQAWRARQNAVDGQRELFAMALVDIARTRDEVARMRGFDGAIEEAHFDLLLRSDDVERLYARILARGELHRDYQTTLAERARHAAGVDALNVWDQNLVDPNRGGTLFTIDEATRAILAAVEPFGERVRREFAHLLDPANGRMDIVPGAGRVPGAFAWGVPGLMTTFFYQGGYQGTYRDLSVLAHEASHAVHGQLLGENRALVSADMGPPYLAEGLAMFFELLLNDHLIAATTDPAQRTWLREQFLWRGMLTFNVTRQAALEHAIYEGVRAGRVSSADHLDSLAVQLGRGVSIWYDRHPELRNDWNAVQHYFNTPLYVPNYAYASILGLTLYAQYHADPTGFPPRLLALLEGGSTAPPAALLHDHLGISLDDEATVNAALDLLGTQLRDLQAAYAQEQPDSNDSGS